MAEVLQYLWSSDLCRDESGQCTVELDPEFATLVGFITKCQAHKDRQAQEGWTDQQAFDALKVKTQDKNYAIDEIGEVPNARIFWKTDERGRLVITGTGLSPGQIATAQLRINARLGPGRVIVK